MNPNSIPNRNPVNVDSARLQQADAVQLQKQRQMAEAKANMANLNTNPVEGSNLAWDQRVESTAAFSHESVQILDQMTNDLLDHLLPPDSSRTEVENLSTRLDFIREQAPELHRELNMFREAVRQVREAVLNQGMDIMQSLNMMRVDQGGALFQKFQDFLSKGFPLERNQFFQKLETLNAESVKNIFGSAEALSQFLQKNQGVEAQSKNPALAILEMVRAEINPQKTEHFLVALQIFSKDLNPETAQKLLSYLKRRGVLSEEDYLKYRESYKTPAEQSSTLWGKEEMKPIRFWYILLAVLCFFVSYSVSYDFVASSLVGVGMAGLMGLLNFIIRKK